MPDRSGLFSFGHRPELAWLALAACPNLFWIEPGSEPEVEPPETGEPAPPPLGSLHWRLRCLLDEAPVRSLARHDRLVVISDLHLGDGGPRDEFLGNASLVETVLCEHYLASSFGLVLNGDVEELQKFPLRSIQHRWREMYLLWERFRRESFLAKLVGNHDAAILGRTGVPLAESIGEALALDWRGRRLLLFHGHQAGRLAPRIAPLTGWILRWVARPLRIRNGSSAHDSRRRYFTERRVYNFARRERIVAVIGHTHRPLFESLSRQDSLRFELEGLCRLHASAGEACRPQVVARIRRCQAELERVGGEPWGIRKASLYSGNPLVPCLFNSGCAIGKRGFTALEIDGGRIALVHWTDGRRGGRHLQTGAGRAEPLPGADAVRIVLKEDDLDYIFTRVQLLA